ncbi:ribonuclease E/G [Haematobacter genomosp. 1]|uniref:Ribonuclease G n=1 Tax=Haematobacter genomosp. 1 TaxID=366618 RepID=A0A212AD27_9RHOB|nr:ribonuclease E/G [Haematobacter genomosp. 1]OWJ78923.1 ribonuclease G [Haematobacter genomosp. 1]
MKGRVILLDHWQGRPAAALLVDGRLEDFLVDPPEDAGLQPGAICRGIVDRQMKGQGGVFLRLPDGQKGFLRQAGGLSPGQSLIVQVTGWAEPGKAVPVGTRLLFKSRLAIVTPGAPGLNVSRAIHDADVREALTAMAETAMSGAPEDFGLVLRTAAARAEETEIVEDIAAMRGLAEAVIADTTGGPELLVEGAGAWDIAWRDWSDPPADEVDDAVGAFVRFGVEEQIEDVLLPTAVLLGSGSLHVEPTRALVAVDVNTGGDTSPAAGLKANIAAARELPRLLRLKGLGGQIIVDFAPMPKKDRSALEQVLRAAFRAEGGETSLAGWTPLGNFELQRKRERLPLVSGLA